MPYLRVVIYSEKFFYCLVCKLCSETGMKEKKKKVCIHSFMTCKNYVVKCILGSLSSKFLIVNDESLLKGCCQLYVLQ